MASQDLDLTENDDILSLLGEMKQTFAEQSLPYLARAELNERFMLGDQFIDINDSMEITEAQWLGAVPQVRRNLLRNLALTWTSRILKNRPNIKAYPNEAGGDIASAKIANAILNFLLQGESFDDLMFRAGMLVQPHGLIGLKVTWDPMAGPASKGYAVLDVEGFPVLDENGQPKMEAIGKPEGDVRWDLSSVFDFGTDGAESIEDSRWCFFQGSMDKWEARVYYQEAGLDEDPSETDIPSIWGPAHKGVEVYEIWHRPGPRFADGLFAVIIGGKVCVKRPFPYAHGELPVAVWKCQARRNSAFSSSHMDDAVPIQKVINEIVSVRQKNVRELGNHKVVGPTALSDSWESENQYLGVDDPGQANLIRYVTSPGESPIINDSLNDNVDALYNVFGLNEMLVGNTGKTSASGRSIAYLDELDSMKIAGAARSLGKAIHRMMSQTLKLYQQYVTAPRIVKIAGDQNALEVMQFVGADIAGVDVRLEPASGTERYRAQKGADAMTQGQAGMIPPGAAAERAETGLDETAFEAVQRKMAKSQIDALMRGEPQESLSDLDPGIALQEILMAQSIVKEPQAKSALMQLFREYSERMQAPAPEEEGQILPEEPTQ